ncbi:MAG: hypothetical protein ACLFV7_12490 [Phycisphaerae bacterium]
MTDLPDLLRVGLPALLWALCAAVNYGCIVVSIRRGRFVSGIPLPLGTAAGIVSVLAADWGSWGWLIPVAMAADPMFWWGLPRLIAELTAAKPR